MGNPLLAAGKLDRRVAILRKGAVSVDDYGQEAEGPAVRVETWARVQPSPGTERFANAENAATAPMRFIFRWRADLIDEVDRIEFDGLTYHVASVTEIGRREGLEVLATARTEGV